MARRPGPAAPSRVTSPARVRGGRLEEVREAAIMLFARDGYAGTNMTDIARELKLVAPSLYNHIASKGELLRQICVVAMDDLLELQRAALDQPDPVSQLRIMTEQHVRFSATRQREIIVTSREFIHLDGPAREEVLGLRRQYERGFRSAIEAGRAKGLFDSEHPKLASYAIIEMGLSIAQWYRTAGPLPVDTVAHDYGAFALRIVGFRGEFE